MVISACGTACEDGWLAVKRDVSLVVPSTLADMEALLRNVDVFQYDHRGLPEPAADNYYVSDEVFASLSEADRALYTWQDDMFESATLTADWNGNYAQVLYTNLVLEGLGGIPRTPANAVAWDRVQGSALFFRSRSFFNLAQQFAPPYIEETAGAERGIPLRLASDVEAATVRSSLRENYGRIIDDLLRAAELLPPRPQFKTDASKAAAFALLARCYLSMRDYVNALKFADSCLQFHQELLDYNMLDIASSTPFSPFNDEVIHHGTSRLSSILTYVTYGQVDSVLYGRYHPDDLRRVLFFQHNTNGTIGFKGYYTGTVEPFGGLAADEVWLIRAECRARNGDASGALDDLAHLLERRYRTGTFRRDTLQAADALGLVLTERRKELAFRGLRWTDLRRLNQEPEQAVTLRRIVNGAAFVLPPNDRRYTLPIPAYILLATGIEQNDRTGTY
ncbi:SusD family protein [Parapedobacter composti]|uniref:SusD family protein n=2 Tax=Parapedobacter composti TaxID=623281 RepID=A0A1I1M182_9SPHI|nr:SusD family protein [Parapedobacter composti]